MPGYRLASRPVCLVRLLPLLAALWVVPATPARADLPPALDKPAPESVEDLKAIQKQVKEVLDRVMPCTVGVRVGGASGSGVIVSKDGYVLTAGHVSGQPNREVTLILPDGKTVKGKTLGGNHGIDSGLIKITDEGEWPFVEMGKSADLKRGQWVVATGHPGGAKKGRTPPVRLGRILDANPRFLRTDCTLVGGDSGGPLFDMEGRVIGIHSRISGRITDNIHVPVDTYRSGWDRMVKAEVWGVAVANASGAFLGVQTDQDAPDCKILSVVKGSPAEKAGMQENDVIVKFDGQRIGPADDLFDVIRKKKPGDEVAIEVRRGDETMKLKVTLAKRGS